MTVQTTKNLAQLLRLDDNYLATQNIILRRQDREKYQKCLFNSFMKRNAFIAVHIEEYATQHALVFPRTQRAISQTQPHTHSHYNKPQTTLKRMRLHPDSLSATKKENLKTSECETLTDITLKECASGLDPQISLDLPRIQKTPMLNYNSFLYQGTPRSDLIQSHIENLANFHDRKLRGLQARKDHPLWSTEPYNKNARSAYQYLVVLSKGSKTINDENAYPKPHKSEKKIEQDSKNMIVGKRVTMGGLLKKAEALRFERSLLCHESSQNKENGSNFKMESQLQQHRDTLVQISRNCNKKLPKNSMSGGFVPALSSRLQAGLLYLDKVQRRAEDERRLYYF